MAENWREGRNSDSVDNASTCKLTSIVHRRLRLDRSPIAILAAESDKVDALAGDKNLFIDPISWVRSSAQDGFRTDLPTEFFIHENRKHVFDENISLFPNHVWVVTSELGISTSKSIIAVRNVTSDRTLGDIRIQLDEKLVEGIV